MGYSRRYSINLIHPYILYPCMCIYLSVFLYIDVYINIYIYIFIHVYTPTCLFLFVHIYIYIYAAKTLYLLSLKPGGHSQASAMEIIQPSAHSRGGAFGADGIQVYQRYLLWVLKSINKTSTLGPNVFPQNTYFGA